MNDGFLSLHWHSECTETLLRNQRHGRMMLLQGQPSSGKRRFLRNLTRLAAPQSPKFVVFSVPPTGTDREILTRLARVFQIADCMGAEPRSELTVAELIAQHIDSGTTLVLNDSHYMSRELLRSVLYLRERAGDADKSVPLVLASSYSAAFHITLGLPASQVAGIYRIPEMSSAEMVGCMKALCPDLLQPFVDRITARNESALALQRHLHDSNLGWIGLVKEFCQRLSEPSNLPFEERACSAVESMGNECRRMEKVGSPDNTQPELPF